MALIPYFILSPNTVLSLIGFIRGADKTIPTPNEEWRQAVVNVVIPAFNEEHNLPLCLASLMHQTLKPKRVILIDDGSTDHTLEYAQRFCKANKLQIEIIHRHASIGKTPTLKRQAREFEADVEFILDADTVLESPNYIERTVQELYQAVGIASACGMILPLYDKNRFDWLHDKAVEKFLKTAPNAHIQLNKRFWTKVLQGISSIYRDVLYFYLQHFIYSGQMTFFGSITNPVGCAVAYRQKYVKELFDKYEPIFGDDLTNSEDIFIGFALINKGYRNIQLQDVYARSQEPKLNRLPKQTYLWSSSFIQSCYYFPALVKSPFKTFKRWRHEREVRKRFGKEIKEKRKIQEPYRQRFGEEHTIEYGRPMGWVILMSLVEKITFPLFLWLMIVMGWWEALGITFLAESTLALGVLVYISKGKRGSYFLKGLLSIPFRYIAAMLDLFTGIQFILEACVFKVKQWRK